MYFIAAFILFYYTQNHDLDNEWFLTCEDISPPAVCSVTDHSPPVRGCGFLSRIVNFDPHSVSSFYLDTECRSKSAIHKGKKVVADHIPLLVD